VPNPREIVLAAYDIAAGTTLLAGHTELRVVPGDEALADALTDRDVATGSVAGAEIPKGQPITPDMLEPLSEETTADAVEPVLLELTFDGESCTYEGPTELSPGPVELRFYNESEESAATNMVSIDEGYTIQDVIDDLGPEPSTRFIPYWTRELGTWRSTEPGERHHWEGDLEMGLYAMVCARLSPLGVWFGTGLTVDG
jgi:hypothetical protein